MVLVALRPPLGVWDPMFLQTSFLHLGRVPDFPGLSRDFDCFDFILEWDGMSGMEVVFDSLIFWPF